MGGSKASKATDIIEKDLSELPTLETIDVYARKKRQLEPDMVGAKLASSAKCVAQFERDAIFRNHYKYLMNTFHIIRLAYELKQKSRITNFISFRSTKKFRKYRIRCSNFRSKII